MPTGQETFGLFGIKFFGDTGGLKLDIQKAVGMVGSGVSSITHTIFNLKTAVLGLAGAGGFVALFESAVNTGEEMLHLSQRVAIGVETLSGYRLATSRAGLSMDDFARSLQFLSRNMLASTQGTTPASKAFQEMGISITDSSGKMRSAEEVMLEVADRFSKMEDGAKKTGYAMEIFGRGGALMVQMLNEGRAALEEQRKEVELFGAAFTTQGAKAAHEFNDNLKTIELAFTGLRNQIVQALLPFINQMVEETTSWIKKLAASGDLQKWAKATSDYIIDAFVAAAHGMEQIALVVPVILDGFRSLMAGIRFAETAFEAAIGGILKTIEKVSAGLAWWAELWGDPWAQKLRSVERATRDWGDTATTAAVQAADAASEWVKSIGSSDALAHKFGSTLSAAALKIEVWGKKAKEAGSAAAKSMDEANKKPEEKTLKELLDIQEKYLKAKRTRGEASYEDELDFLRKRVEAEKAGTIERVQAEADAFKMAQDMASRQFAHEQALGLKSLQEEINREKQKAAAAVAGSEARMQAEENVYKKEEELRNKRQQASLGLLGKVKEHLMAKGFTEEEAEGQLITPETIERETAEMRREQAEKAGHARRFAAGGAETLGATIAGYKAMGELSTEEVLRRELGAPGDILRGGAGVGSMGAGIETGIATSTDRAFATFDAFATKLEQRANDSGSRIAKTFYNNMEEWFVRKLMDQAARS